MKRNVVRMSEKPVFDEILFISGIFGTIYTFTHYIAKQYLILRHLEMVSSLDANAVRQRAYPEYGKIKQR